MVQFLREKRGRKRETELESILKFTQDTGKDMRNTPDITDRP
jgi:hypothetical protein